MLLCLFIFSSGCIPDEPNRVSDINNRRNYSSSEDSTLLDSTVELDQAESVRIAQERRIAEGQEIVEANIQYRRTLDKDNEIILQNREGGAEVRTSSVGQGSINEKRRKAKAHHFKQLELLLKL